MTTTYTGSLRLAQPGVSDPTVKNAWGSILNTDLALLEAAITGLSTIDLTGLATLTLSATNGALDQSRPFGLNFVNAPAGGVIVTIPPVVRFGLVQNAGPGVVTLQTSASASGSATMGVFPDACWLWYYCDGANVNPILRVDAMGNQVVITASQMVTVPPSVRIFRARGWGPGGIGGAGNGSGGGGGGGGGYADALFPVTPGQVWNATIGSTGVQFGLPGVAPRMVATAGYAGAPGVPNTGPPPAAQPVTPANFSLFGSGTAGDILVNGQNPGSGYQFYTGTSTFNRGGPGGDAAFGGGAGGCEAVAYNLAGCPGNFPGGGGGGGCGTGGGGSGGAGLIIVTY